MGLTVDPVHNLDEARYVERLLTVFHVRRNCLPADCARTWVGCGAEGVVQIDSRSRDPDHGKRDSICEVLNRVARSAACPNSMSGSSSVSPLGTRTPKSGGTSIYVS